jgi:hypothetical protein
VNNGTTTGNSTSFTAGDIIGVALDCDNDEITFYKNNTIVGSAQSLEAGQTWFPLFKNSTGVADLQYNPDFGQLGYTYTPPTGFSALSTTNLPTPAIKDGSAYFQTTLFTGTGAVDNEINQTGNSTFQPDVVWIKQRNKVDNHVLTDAVRGEPKALYPNDTSSELVGTGGITSLDPDGFTLSGDGSVWNNVNQSGITAAAWQWLAGNGTASNTDGTITSTVSANQTTGFSIVSWTGSGNSSDNVGTGLSSSTTLGMAIVKRRDSTSEWQVGHVGNQGLNFAYHIELNSTAANSGSAPYFMGTQSNADKLYLSSGSLTSSATYIAYCWNEVEGFSKFGSYTGNGSADGPFVWCGFRPAFVILKNSSAAGYDWQTWDAARSPANVVDDLLRPNATTAETIAANLDFTSNGFKIRTSGSGSNLSGSNYIFMAFAEHPFGGSTVAPVPAR